MKTSELVRGEVYAYAPRQHFAAEPATFICALSGGKVLVSIPRRHWTTNESRVREEVIFARYLIGEYDTVKAQEAAARALRAEVNLAAEARRNRRADELATVRASLDGTGIKPHDLNYVHEFGDRFKLELTREQLEACLTALRAVNTATA